MGTSLKLGTETRVQIVDDAFYVSYRVHALEQSMLQTILSQLLEIVGEAGFFNLGKAAQRWDPNNYSTPGQSGPGSIGN